MKSLNEDLKTGKFKQIYLLFGQEAYLKKQYKERYGYGRDSEDDPDCNGQMTMKTAVPI